MNIWKKLFPDPPPPEQRKIDIGKLTAIINLKDGKDYNFPFEGDYRGSDFFDCFGGSWLDHYTTARKKFEDWKQQIKDSGFLEINEFLFITYNEIDNICVEDEKKVIITTTRAR